MKDWLLSFDVHPYPKPIRLQHPVMLLGSCFTEHMAKNMQRLRKPVLLNPHGIVFNPWSLCQSLEEVMMNKMYQEDELFQLDEYWHSWQHHSDFSQLEPSATLQKINHAIQHSHHFLKTAHTLIITLGTSFVYRLLKDDRYVNNNHRAPAAWFKKELLTIEQMESKLNALHQQLKQFNPDLHIIYTISPVRHIRDGLVENNQSKARLLEVVHRLKDIYYFPAYELVMDVLRDYRFFDIDGVHPNYAATQYVWEKFTDAALDPAEAGLREQLEQLHKARQHQPRDTRSQAHQRFLQMHLTLAHQLLSDHPYLQLQDDIRYFSGIPTEA